jgi:prevent-host-death family protein
MQITSQVGTFDAKNRLSELLDQVERGAEIVITKRGRAVAKLVPIAPVKSVEAARAAARRIDERSKSMTLRGLRIKDLINEGRR